MQAKFKEMVKTLKKPGESILEQLTAEKCDLMHMALGLVGELIEVEQGRWKGDKENVHEELGDVLFYLEGLCQVIGYEPKRVDSRIKHSLGGDILDLAKKVFAYNSELKLQEVKDDIDGVYSHVCELADSFKFDMQDLEDANIKKLMEKRYKNGYSDEAARERLDKAV